MRSLTPGDRVRYRKDPGVGTIVRITKTRAVVKWDDIEGWPTGPRAHSFRNLVAQDLPIAMNAMKPKIRILQQNLEDGTVYYLWAGLFSGGYTSLGYVERDPLESVIKFYLRQLHYEHELSA